MDTAAKPESLPILRTTVHAELRLATLEVEQGHYLDLPALLSLVPKPNHAKFLQIVNDYKTQLAE